MKETQKLNITKSRELFKEATGLVPGGVLGARKPGDFIEGEYPIFLETGKGCRLTDVDGNEFVDFLCGYGPIILGYREEEVDDAVCKQIKEKGFCFTLTQKFQNALARKLTEIVPSSEMSIFLKTGSDATTATIRIARAYTGKIKVMRCGYHGWHDWCVEMKGGIPSKFYEDVFEFQYNRLDQLEELMARHGDETAAIIMTPFGHPNHQKMQEPDPGFLEGVRELADKYGAVLIYDEIRTAFRLRMGGAQELYGVTPDLTVLGKAIANGYPISVVTGKKDVMMAAADKLFISSTFFPNSKGFVAALKTIEILERDKVIENIWEKGDRFIEKIRALLDKYDVGAELTGVAPMFFITFEKDETGAYKDKRTDFYTQLIRKGFFFSPYHHSYISFRHTEEDLNLTLTAIKESLAYVKEKY
jgi:glutamate-1-semialdehyde aminotransferase